MNGRRQVDDPQHVRIQYSDAGNLSARARLHHRYSTHPTDWMGWLMERLVSGSHRTVLDVGGGPGFLWRDRQLLTSAERVVVSDLSSGMVATARAAIGDPCFRFLVANAEALPFASSSFEVVVANHMLYHVPHVDGAVSEIARVLVPGGRLLAATNGTGHMRQLDELVNQGQFTIASFNLETGGAILSRHFSHVAMEEYEDALVVDDPEPILDYIRSMADFWVGTAPEDDIREKIERTIVTEGAFRIDKRAGLFTAVRP